MPRNPGGTVSGFKLLGAPDGTTVVSSRPPHTGIAEFSLTESISFDAPLNPGDSAVSSYVVTLVNQSTGEAASNTGTSSPISVTVSSGGVFDVSIQAVNTEGPGRITTATRTVYTGNSLWAWGVNGNGQLGDGSTDSKSSPIQVGALTDWTQATAGGSFSIAVRSDNSLWAWGLNTSGQLGLGNVVSQSSPTQVGALTDWSHASAGTSHVLAIKTNGTLWAWGLGTNGQLGDGSTVSKSSPVQIGALTTWNRISGGGAFSLGNAGSSFFAWGLASSGQLDQASNSVVQRNSPVASGSGLGVWFSAGSVTSHGINSSSILWGWGGNSNGQIGDNNAYSRSNAVQIGALTWFSVSSNAGGTFTLAVRRDNSLWAWGLGTNGQLGDDTAISKSSPVQVGSDYSWETGSAGGTSSFGIKLDGTLWAWGNGGTGRLGDDTVINKSSPVQIGALSNWRQVIGGSAHTLALYGVTS